MSKEKTHLGHIILITLSAAIGGFLFGFDSSVINGANGALKIHFNATDYQLAWAVSLALIGAAVGAYFAGRLADKFGRVRCMLASVSLASSRLSTLPKRLLLTCAGVSAPCSSSPS